ncbi:polymorphic toxin-type HINT domain-containing protein [Paenibacillus cellulositrophicus]|uniref:polymorphic toxin-type HINT domain-containing protein n=1 Tax=Paenibacillus cellulositrophicus TaxID=562959 RepID=UPI00203B18A9|nr:polymorphic toxin-type HINT domain-containing protein [Paenibacillus cellulositrophicus]MCM2997178.1 polymorphic toxin-type HINT domain-containing protein [Paenibacillus cellulositrophicus]
METKFDPVFNEANNNRFRYLFGLLTQTSPYKNSEGSASWAKEQLLDAYDKWYSQYLLEVAGSSVAFGIGVGNVKNNGRTGTGCNCFVAGTKVQTDEGEKNIEDIEVGDKVLSKNEETGEVAYKEVLLRLTMSPDEIYKVHVGDQVIESTYNHPFWVDGKEWTYVKDLKVGDLLVQSGGNTLKIDSIELENKHVTVYNMTVDEFHTYFVSGLVIWVHNTSCFDAAGFEKRIFSMNVNERVATVRTTAADIAKQRGWTKDSKLTRINGRDVYYDSSSRNYYALDTQHGRFEVVNKRGKYQGEVNFNLDPTKAADTKGGHDLIIK